MADRSLAREIAGEHLSRNDPVGWFEALYRRANADAAVIPWADLKANVNLTHWLDRERIAGGGKRAIVIGCGLGDDAEELAQLGFQVTAFDISPTAVEWCQRRFPNSAVHYVAADLFQLDPAWLDAFDFVFESYTLQVLPVSIRHRAMENVARLVAPSGTLLVVCRARNESDPPGQMPWPLMEKEVLQFEALGLSKISLEDFFDPEEPDVRRFRAVYLRSGLG
jgi:SAM-dependent methyltransferase